MEWTLKRYRTNMDPELIPHTIKGEVIDGTGARDGVDHQKLKHKYGLGVDPPT